MTTLHLVIVCATGLAAIALVLRGLEAKRPTPSAQGSVLAGQIAVAIAGKQNEILEAQLEATERIASHTAPDPERGSGPSHVGKTLAIRTRRPDTTTVRGICAADYADRFVLEQATVYETSDGRAAAGLVEVLKVNVSTVQIIEPAPPEAG